jgi:hypothetical protein
LNDDGGRPALCNHFDAIIVDRLLYRRERIEHPVPMQEAALTSHFRAIKAFPSAATAMP